MRCFVLSVLIALAAALPFARAVRYGLVNCDDYQYVVNVTEFDRGVFSVADSTWMPQTWLSYKLDLALAELTGRDRFRLMHAQNVLWHSCNAVLLFFLLLALAPGRTAMAFAGALLWALHPLRVESVAWVASRKDVLSLFWLLLALLAWMRGRLRVSGVLFLVAATAKQSVMTYPVLVVILDCLVLRRAFDWRRYVLPSVLAFAVAVLAVVAQGIDGGCATMASVPLWWKLVNAATAVGIYVRNMICPLALAPQCLAAWPRWPQEMSVALPFAFCAVALAAVCWRVRERRTICRFGAGGLLFFFAALTPMLGIVGFGYHAYADRFTYIPSIGLSVLLLGIGGRIVPIAVLAVSVAFGGLARRQVGYWRDDGTLWSHALRVHGDDDWHAHRNLGFYHYEFTHDIDRAIGHFRKVHGTGDPAKSDACLLPYLFALCEKGEAYRDEARKVYYDVSYWDSRMVRNALGDDTEGVTFTEFRVARVIFLFGDPDLRAEALRDAEVITRRSPNSIFVKYMNYVIGRSPAADVKTDSLKQYIRFSFLR